MVAVLVYHISPVDSMHINKLMLWKEKRWLLSVRWVPNYVWLPPILHSNANPDTHASPCYEEPDQKDMFYYNSWDLLVLIHIFNTEPWSCCASMPLICCVVYSSVTCFAFVLQVVSIKNINIDVRSQLCRSRIKGKACLKHLKEIFHLHSF